MYWAKVDPYGFGSSKPCWATTLRSRFSRDGELACYRTTDQFCNCRRSWSKLLQTYSLDGSVRFIIPVADGEPNQATPLQGFSMSLCYNSHLIRAAAFLPSSIYDLTPEGIRTFAARRVCGVDPINWLPMSPRAIRAVPLPAFLPFNVLLLGDTHAAADYRNWARSCEIAPLVVADKKAPEH